MAQPRTIKIDLNLTRNNTMSDRNENAFLVLETHKGYRGGVCANAQVQWCGKGFFTHALFSDFDKCVGTAQGAATQANIDRVHAKAFTAANIEALKSEAFAHSQAILLREARERSAESHGSDAGAMVAEYKEETGCDWSTALAACNCD
jgi:hypothetical protein